MLSWWTLPRNPCIDCRRFCQNHQGTRCCTNPRLQGARRGPEGRRSQKNTHYPSSRTTRSPHTFCRNYRTSAGTKRFYILSGYIHKRLHEIPHTLEAQPRDPWASNVSDSSVRQTPTFSSKIFTFQYFQVFWEKKRFTTTPTTAVYLDDTFEVGMA